jgi:hypothetical protein
MSLEEHSISLTLFNSRVANATPAGNAFTVPAIDQPEILLQK